nr:AMP-binding protein [Rhodococcus sp. B10]
MDRRVRTIPALIAARAAERPDASALRGSGTTRSYGLLAERVASMGGALLDHGVVQGDSVLVLSSNRIEMVEAMLGCVWIGAVAVPVNPELRGDGLTFVLAASGARHVFTEPVHTQRIRSAGFRGALWEFGSDAPSPETGRSVPAADVDSLDTAMVLFTSGTTGPPKGVRCPHAQFVYWGLGVGDALAVTQDDVLYNCLPFFHTNAINAMFQAFVAGATFVLGQRFSARAHWADVADAQATVTYLLGAMVAMLSSLPPSEADRAHSVTRSLAPATPPHLYTLFRERFGVDLIDGFGSTETNLVLGNDWATARPGYLGTVRPGYDAVVLDADNAVADGNPGELVVRTHLPGAFATGYLGEPIPATDSWRRTGDRVVREPDGWFRFVDRIKDVIRRRGENVSSVEVETVLGRHPAVAQVVAFPVPSSLAEDDIMVAVVPRTGHVVDPLDLLRRSEPHLPYFALPRYVDVVDELPLTDTGKVRKAELSGRGVGPNTWDAERYGYVPTRVVTDRTR